MDRDTMIALAREAGAVFPADGSWHKFEIEGSLERFATLAYERGFVDGMSEQAKRSVDKAVNRMAEPRPIQECYGDCPTNPQTCPNPCNFEGRPKPEQNPFGDDAERYARKLHEEREYYKALFTERKPEQEPDGISWLKRDSGYFTAPTPRKPLTEGEMPTLFVGGLALNSEATTEIVRAVEKAHGIGDQDE